MFNTGVTRFVLTVFIKLYGGIRFSRAGSIYPQVEEEYTNVIFVVDEHGGLYSDRVSTT